MLIVAVVVQDNPLAGWSWVYIPYCTGDAHSGNRSIKYGFRNFNHVGFVNAKFAVHYAASSDFIPNPEATFTTGVCSFGLARKLTLVIA